MVKKGSTRAGCSYFMKATVKRAESVRQILRRHLDGIGFNQLCEEATEFAARQTIKNLLDQLIEDGVVDKTPLGKQRVLYRLTNAGKMMDSVASNIVEYGTFFRDFVHYCSARLNANHNTQSIIADLIHTFFFLNIMLWSKELEVHSTFRGSVVDTLHEGIHTAFYSIGKDFLSFVKSDSSIEKAYTTIKREKKLFPIVEFKEVDGYEIKESITNFLREELN